MNTIKSKELVYRRCWMCGKQFTKLCNSQVYCGSWTKKEGCSWLRHKVSNDKWRKKHPEDARWYRIWNSEKINKRIKSRRRVKKQWGMASARIVAPRMISLTGKLLQ